MRSYRLPSLALFLFIATLLFFSYDTSSAHRLNFLAFIDNKASSTHSTPPESSVTGQHASESDTHFLWSLRSQLVRQAFLRAYNSYERYAPFPDDELLPRSNGSIKNLNAWGLTMVDSLDTMLLMGYEDIFVRSISHVATINFTLPTTLHAPFFETTIRYLGGFLSAYALTKEPMLLARADQLGQGLMYAFNTPANIPMYAVNLQTQELRGASTMAFAEIASCQMEFKYLAYLTGREEYFTKSEYIMELLAENQDKEHGMWPTMVDVITAKPSGAMYSVGAYADSAYEYLLKQYLLSGKTEERLALLYTTSMTGILENLLYLSPTRNLLYVTDTSALTPSHKFEHLSCFFPGLLALGVSTLPEHILSSRQRELHMWAAEGIAHTCWIMYADQPSGLGADIIQFVSPGWSSSLSDTTSDGREGLWITHVKQWERDGRPGGKPPGVGNASLPIVQHEGGNTDYTLSAPYYLLRPETLEAMYVMYRVTKDQKWRQRGWDIWEAVEAKTRTESAYTSVFGLEQEYPQHMDSMPSYFLAETVKYAFLLASESDPWPMDGYVFNTEGHPFPIFQWRDWEIQRYGIGKKWRGWDIGGTSTIERNGTI